MAPAQTSPLAVSMSTSARMSAAWLARSATPTCPILRRRRESFPLLLDLGTGFLVTNFPRSVSKKTSSRWTKPAKRSLRSSRSLTDTRKRLIKPGPRLWPHRRGGGQSDPKLAVRDGKGQIQSIRYNAITAMLLNEFLKEHKRVEAQQSKIDEQEATIAELKSTLARQQ